MARTKIEPTQESIAEKLAILGNKKFSEL
jgi:hypothetical protein